jgi:hypothetical protein
MLNHQTRSVGGAAHERDIPLPIGTQQHRGFLRSLCGGQESITMWSGQNLPFWVLPGVRFRI